MSTYDQIEDTETTLAAPGNQISAWTVGDIKKSDILVFRDSATEYIDSVVAPNGFQVGLLDENFLTDLLVTGHITGSGVIYAELGFSGSLTKLVDGDDYLVAGSGITLLTQSNGSILISSTGGGTSGRIKKEYTTTLAAGDPLSTVGLSFGDYDYSFDTIDVFLNGELLQSGSQSDVSIAEADYYLAPDQTDGQIVFSTNITNSDLVTVTINGGSGGTSSGTGSEYFAGTALDLNSSIFDVRTDGVTIGTNTGNQLSVLKTPGSLVGNLGLQPFSFDGSSNTTLSVKAAANTPIEVTTAGVGFDLTGQTAALQLTNSDELLIWDGAGYKKTTAGELASLVQVNTQGAPVDATYLTISNTTDLTHERTLSAGDGLIAQDGGANGSYVLAVTIDPNGHLQFNSGKLAVNIGSFAGLGLVENVTTGKIDIDYSTVVGTGLTHNGAGTISIDFGSNAGQVAAGDNQVTLVAGDGLDGGGSFLLGQTNSGINFSVDSEDIAGIGTWVNNNNININLDGINGIQIISGSNNEIIIDGSALSSSIGNISGSYDDLYDLIMEVSGSVVELSGTVEILNQEIIDLSTTQLLLSSSVDNLWIDQSRQDTEINHLSSSIDVLSGSISDVSGSLVALGQTELTLNTGLGISGGDVFKVSEPKTIDLSIDAVGLNGIQVYDNGGGSLAIDGSLLVDAIADLSSSIGNGGGTTGQEYTFGEGLDITSGSNPKEVIVDFGSGSSQVPRGDTTLILDTGYGLNGGDFFVVGEDKIIDLSLDIAGLNGIQVYDDGSGTAIVDGSALETRIEALENQSGSGGGTNPIDVHTFKFVDLYDQWGNIIETVEADQMDDRLGLKAGNNIALARSGSSIIVNASYELPTINIDCCSSGSSGGGSVDFSINGGAGIDVTSINTHHLVEVEYTGSQSVIDAAAEGDLSDLDITTDEILVRNDIDKIVRKYKLNDILDLLNQNTSQETILGVLRFDVIATYPAAANTPVIIPDVDLTQVDFQKEFAYTYLNGQYLDSSSHELYEINNRLYVSISDPVEVGDIFSIFIYEVGYPTHSASGATIQKFEEPINYNLPANTTIFINGLDISTTSVDNEDVMVYLNGQFLTFESYTLTRTYNQLGVAIKIPLEPNDVISVSVYEEGNKNIITGFSRLERKLSGNIAAFTDILIPELDLSQVTDLTSVPVYMNGILYRYGTETEIAGGNEHDYTFVLNGTDTYIRLNVDTEINDVISVLFAERHNNTIDQPYLTWEATAIFDNSRQITVGDGLSISLANPREFLISNTGITERKKHHLEADQDYIAGTQTDTISFDPNVVDFSAYGYSDDSIDILIDGKMLIKDIGYQMADSDNTLGAHQIKLLSTNSALTGTMVSIILYS
jgi:hypothetical protein